MDKDGCLFCPLLIFAGLFLILLSLLPQVGCLLPNSLIYIVGCFFAGGGVLGDIRSLAGFRLGLRDSPSNRRWLRTWPIVFRSLMLAGVVAIYLPVQLSRLPSFDSQLSPRSPGSCWPSVHLGGLFCLMAGLLTSAVALAVRARLLESTRPLSQRQKLLVGLVLLVMVLLAGGLTFPTVTPDPSYCQGYWDCDLVGWSGFSGDLNDLQCISNRYSVFWPPTMREITPDICPSGLTYHPPCYCQDNRCIVNYGSIFR